MTKEPYVHVRRALYACQKNPMFMTKEPCIHHKKALHAGPKSPMFMTKEAYIHSTGRHAPASRRTQRGPALRSGRWSATLPVC